MSILEGACLGLIQGLAEFLPISSSGHLNLLQALFGAEGGHQLLFNLLLHVATLAAVGIVFWRDWADMLMHPIRNRTLVLLFVASMPALAAKLLFDDALDYVEVHNTWLGICFVMTGIMLWLTQRLSSRAQAPTVGVKEALAMGCLQAVGMLPGISRSGSTIFGGVCAGVDRSSAARFSFLMSAPAIVAGMLSEGVVVLESGVSMSGDIPAILVGMAVAFVAGYLSIRFFLKLISRASLNGFALYTAALGVMILLLQACGIQI